MLLDLSYDYSSILFFKLDNEILIVRQEITLIKPHHFPAIVYFEFLIHAVLNQHS
jgi:hypothetical protein